VLLLIGYIDGLAGLVAGTVYYLSPTVAGALTGTEPTTVGQVSRPLLIALSATTGFFFNWRSILIELKNVVKISSADTTQNYLENKVIAGSNITITKNNPGGDETLTIASSTSGFALFSVQSLQNVVLVPINTVTVIDIVIDTRNWNGKKVMVTGVAGVAGAVPNVTLANDPNLWETIWVNTWGGGGWPQEDWIEYNATHANWALGFCSFWNAVTSSEIYLAGCPKAGPHYSSPNRGWYLALNASGHLIWRVYAWQSTTGAGVWTYSYLPWMVIQNPA